MINLKNPQVMTHNTLNSFLQYLYTLAWKMT